MAEDLKLVARLDSSGVKDGAGKAKAELEGLAGKAKSISSTLKNALSGAGVAGAVAAVAGVVRQFKGIIDEFHAADIASHIGGIKAAAEAAADSFRAVTDEIARANGRLRELDALTSKENGLDLRIKLADIEKARSAALGALAPDDSLGRAEVNAKYDLQALDARREAGAAEPDKSGRDLESARQELGALEERFRQLGRQIQANAQETGKYDKGFWGRLWSGKADEKAAEELAAHGDALTKEFVAMMGQIKAARDRVANLEANAALDKGKGREAGDAEYEAAAAKIRQTLSDARKAAAAAAEASAQAESDKADREAERARKEAERDAARQAEERRGFIGDWASALMSPAGSDSLARIGGYVGGTGGGDRAQAERERQTKILERIARAAESGGGEGAVLG
jgi:hypothetical protein